MINRQEKIDFIRAKCIEANPDILKLEFGCWIKNKKTGSKWIYLGTDGEVVGIFDLDRELMAQPDWSDFQEEFKIIGRPIRLADILLAINKEHDSFMPHTKKEEMYFQYKREGGFVWNLKAGDITLQSDETVDLVFNLLGGK